MQHLLTPAGRRQPCAIMVILGGRPTTWYSMA